MDNAYDTCRTRSFRTSVSVHQLVVPHQSPFRIKAVGSAPGREDALPLAQRAPENRRYPIRVQVLDNAVRPLGSTSVVTDGVAPRFRPGPTPCGLTAEAVQSTNV